MKGIDRINAFLQPNRRRGLLGRAERNVIQRIFRTDPFQMKHLIKAGPQLTEERQGTAEIQHVPLNGPSLGQTGNGLVDHRHENGTGDVLVSGALVEERLDIRLGKNAAAGGDGIGLFGPCRRLVHIRGGRIEKGRHLINKRTRAACTGSVHPDLQRSLKKEYFGILAAQLDDTVRSRHQRIRGHLRRINLLNKGQPGAKRKAHAGGTGNTDTNRLIMDKFLIKPGEKLPGFLCYE